MVGRSVLYWFLDRCKGIDGGMENSVAQQTTGKHQRTHTYLEAVKTTLLVVQVCSFNLICVVMCAVVLHWVRLITE